MLNVFCFRHTLNQFTFLTSIGQISRIKSSTKITRHALLGADQLWTFYYRLSNDADGFRVFIERSDEPVVQYTGTEIDCYQREQCHNNPTTVASTWHDTPCKDADYGLGLQRVCHKKVSRLWIYISVQRYKNNIAWQLLCKINTESYFYRRASIQNILLSSTVRWNDKLKKYCHLAWYRRVN